MKYCSNCGSELNENQDVCLNCGSYVKKTSTNDTGSIGWFFLGLFIPLAGIILYALWYDERPKDARRSLYGFITSIIVGIIFVIITFMAFASQIY